MRRKKRILFIILSVIIFFMFSSVSIASTAGEDNKLHTLEGYIKHALLNNPGLKAAYDKWQAALEKVGFASTLPDPKFTFEHYIEEVETRTGAQRYSVGINQTLPWFGKLDLKGKAALEAANAEKARYEALKLNLIAKIKKLYYQYSYLAQAIKITENNITLVSNFESVARTRYKSGTGLQNAVIKIQVELGKLDNRLTSLKDLVKPLAAKLNRTMNRLSYDSLPLPESIPDEKLIREREELISFLKTENPNLKVLDFTAEKNNHMIDLSRKNHFPDVTLGLKYIDTEARDDANPNDNGKNPLVTSVSINIPIWRRKYDAQTRSAMSEFQSVIKNREELENNLLADLEMAIYELKDAERKINLYRDTLLKKAEQNVNINQLAFSSDKASFLDLIDAQRVLLEFQLAEKKALADYGKALAEIEMLTAFDSKGK